MILQLTEVQAELLYRLLGGKTQAALGEAIDIGSEIIGGGVVEESDLEITEALLTSITALRQREDERSIVKLRKVIEDLEASGFDPDTIENLKKAQNDATTHKSKKYALPQEKAKSVGDL